MEGYIIAFDVGGIFIKSAVLNKEGEMISDSYAIYPSKSNESKENLIKHLFYMIKQQSNRILEKNIKISGVGFAFPGPFDYEKGISYIKGVGKFEQLYEINLRKRIMEMIEEDPSLREKITEEFQILFDNDANLFALGEYMVGKGQEFNKAIYLTIGAGTGSAFMEEGKLVKNRDDVPVNGWIYNEPFKSTVVNDYISRKGILKLMKQINVVIKDNNIKTLAEMAQKNHSSSKEVFYLFGKDIGNVLNPHIKRFSPEAIILGGKIAKSRRFFLGGLYETLSNKKVIIDVTQDTSLSTFAGIVGLINHSI